MSDGCFSLSGFKINLLYILAEAVISHTFRQGLFKMLFNLLHITLNDISLSKSIY